MKKIIYVVGCLAAILIVNGILFKVFHWNGANIMLLSGVVLLNIVLPIYFYDTYKKVIPKRS